jgi:hypothetical protein
MTTACCSFRQPERTRAVTGYFISVVEIRGEHTSSGLVEGSTGSGGSLPQVIWSVNHFGDTAVWRIAGSIDGEAAFDELRRLLDDPQFGASERQRRLLRFLCTEEIEGRGSKLKAYTVATGALDRPDEFDPQTDSIVRVEVGRLRRALELYYALRREHSGIVITIPKGSYRPAFAAADHPVEPGAVADAEPADNHAPVVAGNRWGAPVAFMATTVAVFALWALAEQRVIPGRLWTGWSTPERLARTLPAAAMRQLIVVPTRIDGGNQSAIIASQLLHLRLTEQLARLLPSMNVTAEDRADNNSDIDMVLRTTVLISPSGVSVNYLLIDADRSDILDRGRFALDVQVRPSAAIADMIVSEVSRRVSNALDPARVGPVRATSASISLTL